MAKKKKTTKKATKKATKKTEGKSERKTLAKKGQTRSLSDREYKKLWGDNKNSSFEDADVEAGTYSTTLTSCKKGVSKKGDHYMTFNYVISEGEYEGDKLSAYNNLGDEVGVSIAGQTLQKLDYVMEEIEFEDLGELAKDITEAKHPVLVEVKKSESNGKEYQNVYLLEIEE